MISIRLKVNVRSEIVLFIKKLVNIYTEVLILAQLYKIFHFYVQEGGVSHITYHLKIKNDQSEVGGGMNLKFSPLSSVFQAKNLNRV